MPEKNPRSPKRSWRDNPRTGGAPRQGRRAWQREPGQESSGPRLTRRGKLALAAAAFVVVVVALLVVALWPRPVKPFRLVLLGAGYPTNLAVPPNAFGARGLAGLADWAGAYNRHWAGDKHQGIDVHDVPLTADGGPLAEALKELKSPTLLVFVAAHGGVDGEGPYLLPDDYSPRRPPARSRLAALLDALRQLPDKNKLLVLDVTAAPADWPLGLLHNDFARRLAADLGQNPVPDLAILCASGPGQRSWASEEAGRTIFAHYVLEGLRGAAATNGRVTARSLADYVTPAVERWVRHNRAALQRPVLLDPGGVAGMELVVADGDYAGQDPGDPGPFSPPDALRQAWQDRFELDRSTPHPAVNTPHWWRQYQDTLLRYEQLARAGDDQHAGALQKGLDDLKGRIQRGRRLPLASRANTLTLPAALGWAVPEAKAQALRQQEAALGAARENAEEYQAKLDALLRGAADPLERQLLRGLLLERARQSAEEFDRVCRDGGPLARLDEAEAPAHPAEAHFALQLGRDLPERAARWGPARQALESRQRAEEAALGLPAPPAPAPRPGAYSEEVLPWNRALVEKGDAQRRGGEDRLFGAAGDAAAAADALTAAGKDYTAALARAAGVRDALGARDRALAELPYYTRWLARQPLDVFSRQDEDQHAALWAKVRELSALLDKRDGEKINELGPPAKAVREGLDALAAQFQERCNGQQSDTQKSWHELDALLSTPFVEPARREELLKRLREIGAGLNRQMARGNPGGPTEPEAERLAHEAALRQGRLAVAVLGKDQPDARLAEARLALAGGDGWAGLVVAAGGHVADGLAGLAREASAGAEEGRKLPLPAAADKLRPAAQKARRLDGGAVAAWLADGADPVGEYRAVQLHDLLVWQAQRTYRDYWSSAAGAPFYRAAGELYLADARRQVAGEGAELSDEQRAARLAEVTAWGAKLRAPDQFTAGWFDGDQFRPDAPLWHLTDEPRLVRRYGVAAPAQAPPGELALWPEPGQSLRREKDGEGRQLLKVSADPQAASVRAVITPEPAGARDATEQVSGYFRGRRFALTTPVRRYYQPDLTWLQHRWEREAGVAVRADPKHFAALAAAKSELMIVLDYSGSMNSLDKPGGSPRIVRALDALEGVLKKVPKGVKVGLLTFSDAEGQGIVVRRKPAPWDPEDDTRREMKSLRGLRPEYRTPLVESISRAADLFDKDVPIKKLVVLTDGGDNGFYQTLGRDSATTIEGYMVRKFGDSDVQLTVIGFEINEEQLKKDKDKAGEYQGYKEFTAALEKIRAPYFDVKRGSELAAVLAQSLLDLRFQVDRGKLVKSASVSYFSRSINDLRALSLPDGGNYYIYMKTRALRDRDTEAQRLDLRPGDGLVLDLVPAGGSRFLFQREVYADSDVNQVHERIARQARKDGDWVVAVWQNQNHRADPRSPDALQALVTVEKGKGVVDPDVPLRQERPDLVWFGLAPGSSPDRPRPGLRFYPLPDYPAPAWRLELPEWPRDQDVVLDSWFLDKRPLYAARLDRGTDYKTLSELDGKSVERGGREMVRVESVGWESVAVEETPGKPRAVRNCLVVRLSFPDGTRPFFARLPEDLQSQVAGYEHRFYAEAGKYTGIFWDVDPSTANALSSLELISVEEARSKAPPGEKLNLGKPRGPSGAAPPKLPKLER
jgi:Mg-chelatase subunit ChlD